jgi:hypothetical protein
VQHYPMHRFALSLVVLALPSLNAAAQEPKATPPTPAEQTPHISPALGIHYGTPLRFSLAVGLLVDVSASRNDGVVLMAEPGREGNEVSAGYFRMLGRFGSGYSLRGAVLRTGGEPWNASPHTTYVGVEAHWMIVFGIGGRVGYLRRASRSVADPHDNLASVGISIGG